MIRKLALLALGMLVPVAASAALLASDTDRSAAAGDYLVTSDLSTDFGRMSGSGDYLPGGEPAPAAGTGYEQNILLLGVGR